MKILVVKLTSMGDAIHLLPALSDLQTHNPQATIDWMVEESFNEIPAWHPSVNRTISVATRRWRSFSWSTLSEFWRFRRVLRNQEYDAVIDAQGLIKSAIFARFARVRKGGRRIGFSANSIKEKPAAKFYEQRINVGRQQHAVVRLRKLFARAFDYELDSPDLDYRIQRRGNSNTQKAVMFLHGTTWASKHLPEALWHELVDQANQAGYEVLLPWGNDQELQRANRLAKKATRAKVMAKSTLTELQQSLRAVAGVIAVDTGLGHLAAALAVPSVSIYGSTNAALTGTAGENQTHLQTAFDCSPCFLKTCNKLTPEHPTPPCYATLNAEQIWANLMKNRS